MTKFAYRPDIDGLRTLAVIPVILFHAGATWMPGGFVGVDIFFVISGYLISSIILREVQAGEFSFLRFYERRLRRIIPALLVVLLVTVAVFQVIALPDQAQGTAESAIAALLSASNFYFWRESGYFAPTAEFLPLLHTWSLAVEEQFYLVFPVILLAVWKLRLPVRWVIVSGTVIAFVAGLWLSFNKPSVAYYLLPARAWELAIGAIVATGAVPKIRGALLGETVPAIGIGMILFSIFWIRSDMIFPGWVALIPCLGAAMVIHAGGRSWVARRILAARPMVFIGLLSYSLYLWHWPVLAALRIRSASIHLDPAVAGAAMLLIFGLAWFSWRYIERPFRDSRAIGGRRMLALLGGGSVAMVGVAALSILMAGFPARLPETARIALTAADDIDPLQDACRRFDQGRECRFGSPTAAVEVAVIGDSHAAALRPAVEASGMLGAGAGTLIWAGSCPFLDGAVIHRHPNAAACERMRQDVWSYLDTAEDLHTVILAGRWAYHLTGILPESGGSNRAALVDNDSLHADPDLNPAVFRRALGRTLDRLEALGLDVVILGAVPEPGYDVPHTVALARLHGLAEPQGPPRRSVEDRAARADRVISDIAASRPGVTFKPIWTAFCAGASCDIERTGVPLYFDNNHLSYSGALMMAAAASP